MINFLDFDTQSLEAWLGEAGEKPFRARQLMRWVHSKGECNFEQMNNVSKLLRSRLTEHADIQIPAVISDRVSDDGTRKWLFDVGSSNAIETVFIPETQRGTLCVSSQVGCALECAFCSTGRQGFNRNLSTGEILAQLWWAKQVLGDFGQFHEERSRDRMISNIVFMGMGEPLTNFDNVVSALNVMLDDHAYGLSRRRVTVSTSGIVPAMDRLRDACPVALAVSLHAPDDALRDQLVPINQKYPLNVLMAACHRYLEKSPREFITFEYVMLEGVNDSDAHAKKLLARVRDLPCKFNLIPFNPFPHSGFRRSSTARIRSFAQQLIDAGIVTTLRKTRGDDIDAACGQLAGQVQDKRTRRADMQRTIPLTRVS